MKTSSAGIELIKHFEGRVLQAYKDPVGVWTIGFGHTSMAGPPEVKPGMKITDAEAGEILIRDLGKYEAAVTGALTRVPNQHQFDAMVSLCYNIGPSNFRSSSVRRHFNAGNLAQAAASFRLWNKAKGKVLDGLTRRREAEASLFSRAVLPPPPDVEPAPVAAPKGWWETFKELLWEAFGK